MAADTGGRVARTREGASHHNTLVRRDRFFELALPVLEGGEDGAPDPPSGARLSLTSKRGYVREVPFSEGMRTDDGYCSFRFYDVTAKFPDDEFTAKLTWDGGERVLFEKQKVTKHILAATKADKYVPPFAAAAEAPADAPGDEGEDDDAGDTGGVAGPFMLDARDRLLGGGDAGP